MSEKGDLYLLQATWHDTALDIYRHQNIFRHADSVEEMFEILAGSHPKWSTTDDFTNVGAIENNYISVTVFKVDWSDTKSWMYWVKARRKLRREQIIEEQRDKDLDTIRRLVAKHGITAMEVLALASAKCTP